MTRVVDVGGDPPCWAHLFEPPERDLQGPPDIELPVRAFYRRARQPGCTMSRELPSGSRK